jgi:hypothetical protein
MVEGESLGTEQPDFGDSTLSFRIADLSYHLNKPRRYQSVSPKANTSVVWKKRDVRRGAGVVHSVHSSPSSATTTAPSFSSFTGTDSKRAIGTANAHCSWMCPPPPLYKVQGSSIDHELDPTVRTSHSTLTSRTIGTLTSSINSTSPAHDKSTSGGSCLMKTIVMWKRQQRDEERRLKKEKSHKQTCPRRIPNYRTRMDPFRHLLALLRRRAISINQRRLWLL